MNLFTLQRKETFRAPQWEAKMSIKVVMVLITLYFWLPLFWEPVLFIQD